MNERETFIYYAKSNGIDPKVLRRKIKTPFGKAIITGQSNDKKRLVILKTYTRRLRISYATLRKYMLKDENARKFLDMENEQVNVDLWFK